METVTATGCQLLVYHVMETKVASEKIRYGVLSPGNILMGLSFLTSSHSRLHSHGSTALRTPASTSAWGHAVQDTGVRDTSLHSACKQAHNSKTQGQIRNEDWSYQAPQAAPPWGIQQSPMWYVDIQSLRFLTSAETKLWMIQKAQGEKKTTTPQTTKTKHKHQETFALH